MSLPVLIADLFFRRHGPRKAWAYEHVHKHLKQVEIGGFYDTSNQIEFAIYLLKHAISLERMVINPVGKYCSALRQPWDEGEREEAYRKLHDPDYPLNVSESLWDSTIKFKLFNVLGCALPFALLCLKLSVLACFLSPCWESTLFNGRKWRFQAHRLLCWDTENWAVWN